MLIKSLEQMEALVRANRELSWLGWDVVQNTYNPGAQSRPDGVRINGKWHTQKKFDISTSGWEIPSKFVR
jgi:hypothetical protein